MKRNITAFAKSGRGVSAHSIVGDVARASGGLAAGAGGASGSSSGAAGSTLGSVAALGAFGSTVRSNGLTYALEKLDLSALVGRPTAEVIAAIADRLASNSRGLDSELLREALRETLLEVAAVESDGTYADFESTLAAFLEREGIAALIELFLANYVFSRIWLLIESHVNLKADGARRADAMASAVHGACVENVRAAMDAVREEGKFESLDWFGPEGLSLATQVVVEIESRLRAL